MIWQTLDQKIRKAFSDAAMQYETFSGLQKEIGRELLRQLSADDCNRICDVGMGTGWMASRLKFYYPDSKIVGIDVAEGMCRVAKTKYHNIHPLQADAHHLPLRTGSFDAVVSNLALQWAANLPQAFAGCHRVLRSGGRIAMTMFGRETLHEMFESLCSAGITSREAGEDELLPSTQNAESALARNGFHDITVKRELIRMHYRDLWDLLKWLKNIGANISRRQIHLGKERLKKADEYYREHYKDRWGITVTFEVIWINAVK